MCILLIRFARLEVGISTNTSYHWCSATLVQSIHDLFIHATALQLLLPENTCPSWTCEWYEWWRFETSAVLLDNSGDVHHIGHHHIRSRDVWGTLDLRVAHGSRNRQQTPWELVLEVPVRFSKHSRKASPMNLLWVPCTLDSMVSFMIPVWMNFLSLQLRIIIIIFYILYYAIQFYIHAPPSSLAHFLKWWLPILQPGTGIKGPHLQNLQY